MLTCKYKSWLNWYVSVINEQIQGKKTPLEFYYYMNHVKSCTQRIIQRSISTKNSDKFIHPYVLSNDNILVLNFHRKFWQNRRNMLLFFFIFSILSRTQIFYFYLFYTCIYHPTLLIINNHSIYMIFSYKSIKLILVLSQTC